MAEESVWLGFRGCTSVSGAFCFVCVDYVVNMPQIQFPGGPRYMRRARLLVFFVVLLTLSLYSSAQNWVGILDSKRATDWSTAGVPGGVPNRQTNCVTAECNTLFGGNVSATTIQNALASAPANSVVRIPAGTFTVSPFSFTQDNITLRGAGATTTTLIMNSSNSGCGLFYNEAIRMCKGAFNIPGGGGPAPDHTATWSAGYTKGTTQITVSSTTGMVAGQTVVHLDQLNDSADGWPATGDIYVCQTGPPCSAEGGGSFFRASRAQNSPHLVTAVNGTTVTIDPPLNLATWRSSQSPGLWWGDTGHILHDSGIEDMTVNFTGGNSVGIIAANTRNTWLKGVALINTSSSAGSFVFHYLPVFAFRLTVRDNYFYGPTQQGNTQYTVSPHDVGSSLFENNIFHRNVIPFVPNDPSIGNVFGYNFFTGGFYTGASMQLHNPADMMNLFEGNNGPTYLGDNNHGTHFFNTMFRNHFSGHRYNPIGNVDTPVELLTTNRFFNVIGNVLGDTFYDQYEVLNCNSDSGCGSNPIYNLGWPGNCSFCGPLSPDPNVVRTLMRWGNWDTVTSTNDGGTNDQTGTRFVSSEVPSGITNFPNPVPGSQSLPPSFYLNAKPSWFSASTPWPPIGPDVTNGNITNYGGHAYKIPAQQCYESLGGPLNGAGNPLNFNAATCYGAGGGDPPPDPPTGLSADAK